jgi:lipid-binding SYLF domain-containing protein
MKTTHSLLILTLAASFTAAGADDPAARLNNAMAVLNTFTQPGQGIPTEQIASSDCIAVIPGFKKGAAVVGVGYGRGFISCRKGGGWSSPAAITLEGGSVGVQLGGEEIDIVMLSLDKTKRANLLSDRFAIGSDASAAWGNGKSAHGDANPQLLFYGHTKGAFAGFGLDGTTLKPDASGNKELYGKKLSNLDIIEGGVSTPEIAHPFMTKLTETSSR